MGFNSNIPQELKEEFKSKVKFRSLIESSNLTEDNFVEYFFNNKKEKKFYGSFPHTEAAEADFVLNTKLNKKAIIDFCITHPETSYDILYWLISFKLVSTRDFAGYSKEQIRQIPGVVREVILHPENIYKLKVKHAVDKKITYYITDANLFEAIEWIATHEPAELRNVLAKVLRNTNANNKKLIEHYAAVEDKCTIPAAILEYIEHLEALHQSQVENGRRQGEIIRELRLQKDLRWTDENGELVKLFSLADGMAITSFEDYFFIANYFMNSDMSASEFCRVFQIDNYEGFKKMCEKFSLLSPEFAEFYAENKKRKSQAYVAIIKHQIEDVAGGKLSVQEMLTHQSQMKSLETVMDIGISTTSNNQILRFAESIIGYYYDRIHSYDANSTDESEILKRLTDAEVKFLMPSQVAKKRKTGASIDLGNEFAKPFVIVSNQISSEARNQLFNRRTGLYKKLDSYSTDFDEASYLNGQSKFIMPDGSMKAPSQEIIDMATAYASNHNLFKSAGTMSRIIKSILEGKIEYQAKTEAYREQLQTAVIKKAKECNTLAEYFEKYREL